MPTLLLPLTPRARHRPSVQDAPEGGGKRPIASGKNRIRAACLLEEGPFNLCDELMQKFSIGISLDIDNTDDNAGHTTNQIGANQLG